MVVIVLGVCHTERSHANRLRPQLVWLLLVQHAAVHTQAAECPANQLSGGPARIVHE